MRRKFIETSLETAGLSMVPAVKRMALGESCKSRANLRSQVTQITGEHPSYPKPSHIVKPSSCVLMRAVPEYKLYLVDFSTGDDSQHISDNPQAYLLVPEVEPRIKLPAILCLHQMGTGKDEPAGTFCAVNSNTNYDTPMAYAHELACRGYLTLGVDNPNVVYGRDTTGKANNSGPQYVFDAYNCDNRFPYASQMMKAVWNNMCAIDMLQIDFSHLVDLTNGIGCIGHSLGAVTTLFTTFFDERIKVAVANCGISTWENTGDYSNPPQHEFAKCGNSACENTGDYPSPPQYHQHEFADCIYMPKVRTYMPNVESGAANMPFKIQEILAACWDTAFLVSQARGDTNVKLPGTIQCIEAARETCYSGNKSLLGEFFFDGYHDFPWIAQQEAFSWFQKHLPTSFRGLKSTAPVKKLERCIGSRTALP